MQQERKNRTGMIMLILIVVILILVGYVVYIQFVLPGVSKYVYDKQVEALNLLITQIQQTGSMQLTQADENGNAIVCKVVPVTA